MYQALYRKWRPASFADVVGQKHITDTLRAQLTARRGNACRIQLISDGKQTLAPSTYRVFLCDLEHAYPALLHTGAEGSARCFLPRNAPLGSELCLQFWTSAWQ